MKQQHAATKKTTLRSQDLNCPSCVPKIERELQRLDGVNAAKVYFETGRIVVEHDPAKATNQQLTEAVGKAGYTAKVTAF
jgi:copper chaperone CopZ